MTHTFRSLAIASLSLLAASASFAQPKMSANCNLSIRGTTLDDKLVIEKTFTAGNLKFKSGSELSLGDSNYAADLAVSSDGRVSISMNARENGENFRAVSEIQPGQEISSFVVLYPDAIINNARFLVLNCQ